MDFSAWMEVYLSGRWFSFDPRHNCRRIGRTVIARGRDACDVPLTISFGKHTLEAFSVVTEEVAGRHTRESKLARARPRIQIRKPSGWRLDGAQLSGGCFCGFSRLARAGLRRFSSPLACCGELLVIGADSVQLVLLKILEVKQGIVRGFVRANEFVELDMHRLSVAILRVLNEENHQEGDDGRACIYDELPGIAEAEQWP